MKYFKNILLSFLLLLSGTIYSQNNLIKTTTFDRFDLLFDGVDEFVNIDATLISLATTTKGTLSAWIKPAISIPAGFETILSFGDTDAASRINMFQTTSGTLSIILTNTGVNQWRIQTDNQVFTADVWLYITLVQDGIAPVIYINAVEVDQTIDIVTNTTQWFNNILGLDNGRIGNRNYNSGGEELYFNGNIDETSFWNTNLSSGEIVEIYNNKKPTNLKTHSKVANLVGWYQMGEFSFFTGGNWNIIDASTNNNTGISTNMELTDKIATTLIYEQPLGLIKVGTNLIKIP